MGELINLNRARKAKGREDAKATAKINRLAYGRTASEKAATKAEQALTDRRLDGARRDPAKRPY